MESLPGDPIFKKIQEKKELSEGVVNTHNYDS